MKINSFSAAVVRSDRPRAYQITVLNYLCFILDTNSQNLIMRHKCWFHSSTSKKALSCIDAEYSRCVREHLSPAVSVKSHISPICSARRRNTIFSRGNLLLPCCVLTWRNFKSWNISECLKLLWKVLKQIRQIVVEMLERGSEWEEIC